MQVSLVATPIWNTKTPPLTTAYLTAWLEQAGHDVFQLDWNIELHNRMPLALKEYWDRTHLHKWQNAERYQTEIAPRITQPTLDEYVTRILADAPAIVGISTYSIEATKHLARAIKAADPEVLVVVGGQVCDPGFYGYNLAWSGAIDAVVYGEGEGPLLDIIELMEAGSRDFSGVRGLLLPQGPGSAEDTGLRSPIADVRTLPWPQFDGLPMGFYTENPIAPPFEPSLAVSTLMSRGCVRKCDFCLQAEIWQNFRYRQAEDIYAEMEAYKEKYGVTQFHFNDLLINGNVKQLDRLSDLLLAKPLGLTWGGNAIVSRTLKKKLLEKMVAAGCTFLGFGFESFSTPVLHAMGKKYDAPEVSRLLHDMHDVGLTFFSNLIIGHPAEGRKEFAETVAFLIEHAKYFTEAPTSSLLIVQKNTPIFRAIDYWGIEMQEGDALGWWLKDGSNTLAERKRRAQVMNFFYESLFGTGIKITDMDTEKDLTLGADDIIPRTAQAN
ncbi:MAG: radical SAM protein [Deltaproteobacteria bacterium]|nr:radical SAM protein [Deltaproteobacteria bacterium]